MRPPIPIPTPQKDSPLVLEACRTVVAEPQPVHVPVRLEPYSGPDDCHGNAAKKVQRDGGQIRFGWVVWEVPDWEIRLEFHSVWQSPQGHLVDVSPPVHGGRVVLFLPDPIRVYEGRSISSVHYPYSASPLCREYVEVCGRINRLLLPPGQPPIRAHEVPQAEMERLRARLRRIFARAKGV
jgi:hypothetical protein